MASEEEGAIQQVELYSGEIGGELPESFVLDIRGRRFRVKRDDLLSLPENILYCLSGGFGLDDAGDSNVDEEGYDGSTENQDNKIDDGKEPLASVDFNPDCFAYALGTIVKYSKDLDPPVSPLSSFREFRSLKNANEPLMTPEDANADLTYDSEEQEIAEQDEEDGRASSAGSVFELSAGDLPEIFQKRPALIVLREDLEYYCMQRSPDEDLLPYKRKVGDSLVSQSQIFEGLRNHDKIDSPEFHLMQMLCLAGISHDDTWDFRIREPNRTTILSLQLSKIKIPHQDDIDAIQALQKLLLFWKKPAKKCWWDNINVDGHKVYARRVWTLEITILGVEA